MLLLTFIQKMPNANQAGLDKYLFGQAATLVENDVWLMAIITGFCVLILLLFWKEFKILLFLPSTVLNLLFYQSYLWGRRAPQAVFIVDISK